MEKTLEVRWFFEGLSPTIVEDWFKFECPGKLVREVEKRKDWYACQQHSDWQQSLEHLSPSLDPKSINLKLRDRAVEEFSQNSYCEGNQGDLELKLRQEKLGTHQFARSKHSLRCEGNIEQWCKFSQKELEKLNFRPDFPKITWVGVEKERRKRIERDVKSELTKLKLDRDGVIDCKSCWWTIAFEMTQKNGDGRSLDRFKEVVEQACKTCPEPQLLAINSYGYSHWLLERNFTILSLKNSSN